MTAQEWEHVKNIFDAALAYSEDERSAFVKNACSSEPDLYPKIVDLLQNYTESQSDPSVLPRARPHVFQSGDMVDGRFRVVRFINSGGMGEVYEVFDERLRLRTALKTLKADLASDGSAVSRFHREIRVAREVAHDNLCKVYESVEHLAANGEIITCITMEFIRGETLSDYLARTRPLAPAAALPLIRQIASALDALHAQHILHRDLKPSNVMLEPREGGFRAVVTDFGLAKGQSSERELFESSLHFRAGAPYFMSPELLRGDRPTVASDIYAFGLIVDEMVTRTRAFSASSVQALYYAKLWEQPQSPRQRNPELPSHWTETIIRCLHKEPAQRFPSARRVMESLESAAPSRAARIWRVTNRWILRSAVTTGGLVAAVAGFALAASPLEVGLFDIENKASAESYGYLSRGLTGELTRNLSRVSGLRVVPMRRIRASPNSLHVARFSIDGQLTPVGNQVGLTISVRDEQRGGGVLWRKQFDPALLREPVSVESTVIDGALSALKRTPTLSGAALRIRTAGARFAFWVGNSDSSRAASERPTTNNRALDDLMRGRQLIEQQSPDSVRSGIEILKRAVVEDPSFGLAYAALVNAHFTMMNWNYVPQQQLVSAAEGYAQTAVTVSPGLPEAHEARALVYQHEWQWEQARRDYLEALRLKPTFALARRHYAVLLTQMGDLEEGVAQARRAIQDDPYDQSALPGFALVLYISGRAAEAARLLEPAAERNSMAASQNLGETYALLALQSSGKQRQDFLQKALSQAARVRKMELQSRLGVVGLTPVSDRMYAQFSGLCGDYATAEPYLPRLRQALAADAISPAVLAWVYAALGRKPEALDLLERAANTKDRHMLFMKVYPFLDSLRNEPRFQAILLRMHL